MLISGTTPKKEKSVNLDAGATPARRQKNQGLSNVFLAVTVVEKCEKEKLAKDFSREECLAQQTVLKKDSLND
jgi:hypothetical protein